MTKTRKISLSVLSVAILGLSILCAVRWGVWFGNPPEEPYSVSPIPHRVLLTFGNHGATSRMVSWQADTLQAESHLELLDTEIQRSICQRAEGEVFESRSGRAAFYHCELPHLVPGHHYRYRAVTNGKASPWYDYTMPLKNIGNESDFSFLYFGDIQDTIGGTTNCILRSAWQRNPEVEFVIFGGDLAERPTDAYWHEAFCSIDSIAQSLPVLCVTGNHEYLKYPIRKLERRFTLTFPYFLASKSGDNHVFSLPYRDAQFCLLDSNRELPYLLSQQAWLEEKLSESTARWNIAVLHHPIYSIKGKSNNMMQRWAFSKVFNQQVDLVLQGHEHAYARTTHRDENGRPTTPLYTISHCSPKHYRIEFDERFERYGTGRQYYQKISIHGDTLTMLTFDAAHHDLYDAVDIIKGEHDRATIVDRAKSIPERLEFTPQPGNQKDAKFQQRIEAYKKRKHLR